MRTESLVINTTCDAQCERMETHLARGSTHLYTARKEANAKLKERGWHVRGARVICGPCWEFGKR